MTTVTTSSNKYRGDRLYTKTSHAGIKKILIWDDRSKQYIAPEIGKKYLARKQVIIRSVPKTINKYFESLRECLEFRSESIEAELKMDQDTGPRIKELIERYKKSPTWELLSYSTQVMYEGLFLRWFDLIADTSIRDLNSSRISNWIKEMRNDVDRFGNSNQRKSFRKEFDLLKSLLTWYAEYNDDPKYVSPIRKRHTEEYWLDDKAHLTVEENFSDQVSDDIPLTEDEYLLFRPELKKGKFGDIMVVLADVQYDHSLRVCEVATLMWADIKPSNVEWTAGEIKFQRHIQYIHRDRTVHKDRLVPGLKNKRAVKRSGKRFQNRDSLSKTHPFFPRSIDGLRQLNQLAIHKSGLVFENPETGTFFSYKCIKDKFDRAFKRAKLPYTGTHIIRYGGVNSFMDRYGADEAVAMELLGNKREGRYILRKSRKIQNVIDLQERLNDKR